jgi:hypothetical protein
VPEVLAPLIPLVVALVCLAIAYMLTVLVIALMKPIVDLLSQIPVIGGRLAGLVVKVEQAVSNAIGHAFGAVESLVGACFHEMARMTDWLWREFEAHSGLIAAIAGPLGSLLLAFHAVKSLVHTLAHGSHSLTGRLRTAEKDLAKFEKSVAKFETNIHREVYKHVVPRLAAAEGELSHIEDRVIPGIRSIAQGAEADVTALQKWISDNALVAGTTAVVGAVAWALGRLGLGNLTCPSFGKFLSKWGCGLGGLLDGLLGLVISALALENVCTLLPVLETAFGDVVGPVIHLLTEVPLGGCETPPKGWAALSVAAGPLPPAQTLGALPV